MKVYAVMEEFGQYDGGAHVLEVYADKKDAEARMAKEVEKMRGYPEYRVDEHEVKRKRKKRA